MLTLLHQALSAQYQVFAKHGFHFYDQFQRFQPFAEVAHRATLIVFHTTPATAFRA